MKNKITILIFTASLLFSGIFFTSCEDMLTTDSDLVIFVEDNKINSANDSIYSVIGIINLMQKVADKTILLGEMRADLSTPTQDASTDLKAIADFTADIENKYNKPQEFYAIINNCNYFIATADSAYSIKNQSIFAKELGVVKTFRAWAYMQLCQIYGEVPFYTDPILTEAQAAKNYPKRDMKFICDYFISELEPYKDIETPGYGSIGSYDSKRFYIPIRVLLGEMCLWSDRYDEACQYYYEYLTNIRNPIITNTHSSTWSGPADAMMLTSSYMSGFNSTSTPSTLMFIPMETSDFTGIKSYLYDIFNSTTDNYYFYEVDPSASLIDLSSDQMTCRVYTNSTTNLRDTIYFSKADTIFESEDIFKYGDLRLQSTLVARNINVSETSKYSGSMLYNGKWNNKSYVTLFRGPVVYLRYAEALNRAGYPESAFAILKYGLNNDNNAKYISENERNRAGNLLNFNINYFTENNTQGSRSRGCGNAAADTTFVLPMPAAELGSYLDTVEFQIPLVEEMIFDELALETCFEGLRFGDLIRYSVRRNDNSYLARKVASRNGEDELDGALFGLLQDRSKWYLPLE